jgi:hypothetical protein
MGGVVSISVPCAAPPPAAWSLYARPDRWHEWAPHLRGAWGLGDPFVRAGARGAIRLGGVLPVPARIVSVESLRAWTWQVGPVRMRHWIDPGVAIGLDLTAPGALEPAIAAAYGPLVRVLLGRLARRAQQSGPPIA